jgi:fluoroquinolone resistance protein
MSDAHSPDLERLLAEDSFDGREFVDLDMQGADLRAKEFTSCRFLRCKAQETQWRGSRLDDCRFERCDLTRLQPRGMRAHDITFVDSKLMGVEWTELGQFPQLAFTDCVLDFASFVALSLRKTAYINCKIAEANFFDVDLTEANFAGSDLRSSIFRGCKLARTDFSAATGVYFDPAVNEARGAVIPLETAALLAMQFGLQVAGFTAPVDPAPPATARAARPSPRGGRTKR